jgi:hypothetical protein
LRGIQVDKVDKIAMRFECDRLTMSFLLALPVLWIAFAVRENASSRVSFDSRKLVRY